MKKLLFVPLLLLTALFTWNCEKDDICDQSNATTPRLIIKFFDLANPTLAKNVTNLRVTGEGMTLPLGDFSGTDTVQLPLKTTDDITAYSFILNSTSTTLNNEDKLTFNYTREDIYVSRGCGYKTLFDLDQDTPLVHTDGAVADGFWMQAIIVNQTNIDNENETHISVYF
jgi:hypothetical protein